MSQRWLPARDRKAEPRMTTNGSMYEQLHPGAVLLFQTPTCSIWESHPASKLHLSPPTCSFNIPAFPSLRMLQQWWEQPWEELGEQRPPLGDGEPGEERDEKQLLDPRIRYVPAMGCALPIHHRHLHITHTKPPTSSISNSRIHGFTPCSEHRKAAVSARRPCVPAAWMRDPHPWNDGEVIIPMW